MAASLFNDPTFSDIKIRQIYKDKVTKYAAHKAVLCAHFSWFMTALTGPFQEGSASTIDIRDDDPDVFRTMMEFFYDMELKIPTVPTKGPQRSAYFKKKVASIIHLHALAEKYDAGMLQPPAVQAFTKSTNGWPLPFTAEDLEFLVHAHYRFCSGVLCEMGKALVIFLLNSPNNYFRNPSGIHLKYVFQAKVEELVEKYGEFGADLYLLGLRTGKLVFK
ncbi:BTB/POZ domain protein [Pyrenophora tritici-repentis]|nr:BTB/POZ domain protein [Pyrenophora tritici-repentis]